MSAGSVPPSAREALPATLNRMGTLVLLRHGESEWNSKGLFTGWVDVGLAEKGRQEAAAAGRMLLDAGLRPDVVYTSVLTRAITTANVALEAGGAQLAAGAPLVAAQRAPLRRAAGQGQGPDARGVRRRAVHDLAPLLRRAAAAAGRRRPVVPGRRPAVRAAAARAAGRAPSACATWWRGCFPTGTTRSFPTSRRAGRCWWWRTATRCARSSSTWTGSPTRRSPSSTSRRAYRCCYELDDSYAPVVPGGRYLDPEAAKAAAEAVKNQGR